MTRRDDQIYVSKGGGLKEIHTLFYSRADMVSVSENELIRLKRNYL